MRAKVSNTLCKPNKQEIVQTFRSTYEIKTTKPASLKPEASERTKRNPQKGFVQLNEADETGPGNPSSQLNEPKTTSPTTLLTDTIFADSLIHIFAALGN